MIRDSRELQAIANDATPPSRSPGESFTVVWVTDAQLRLTSCGGTGLAALGLSPDRVVGNSLDDFFQAAESPSEMLDVHRRVMAAKSSFPFPFRWAGNVYQGYVAFQEGASGIGCVGFANMVTEPHPSEKQPENTDKLHKLFGSVLQICAKADTQDELFEGVLDEILGVLHADSEAATGCILLMAGDMQSLILAVQRGCSRISREDNCLDASHGGCFCKETTSHHKIGASGHIDSGHEIFHDDEHSHGYYCLPILSENQAYGVIHLHLPPEHQGSALESDVLVSIAKILAETIKRRQTEEALRESKERFDLAIEGTNAGIWDWDLRTDHIYFSTQWKTMFGYEDAEVVSAIADWENRLHPDDRARAMAALQDYLDGKSSHYEFEHRLRHKDGSYRWILARGAAMRDLEGAPYRMVGSHLDVTEHKEMAHSLHRQEMQLSAAQKVQEHILPKTSPPLPGFDVAGALYPAEFAAGDHFDYLCMPNQHVGISIGDVSGHGFSSALLMTSTCAHLRSLADAFSDVGDILSRLNSFLLRETEEDSFVTLFLATLDPDNRELIFAGAGHPPGYVLGHDGRVKNRLDSTGFPLGVFTDSEFSVSEPVVLDPGDLVLLLTDGVLEVQSSEGPYFGIERALEVVRNNREKTSEEIIAALYDEIRDFAMDQCLLDDVTIVIIKTALENEDVH